MQADLAEIPVTAMAAVAFSVVVPCYNEEGAISETIETLKAHLDATGEYEIVVVDDGSTDGSREILEGLAERDCQVRVVHHERNRGYGAALKTGIRRARGELIVITDADGTYPIERIPELVEIARQADMVVGARTGDAARHQLARRIPKAFLRRYVSWLAGQSVPDMNSGMRVFRKSVAERFLKILPDTFSFTTTITLAMMRNHYDVRFVAISYAPRVGRSKIRPIRDTMRFVQLIVRTGMYFAPLRVLMPVVALLGTAFAGRLAYDLLATRNVSDSSLLLLLFAANTALFALLADMIDKRSPG